MSWYSQMFKSYEVARERNRRVQRRLQVEMGQKHGPQFVAQYRTCELNREQKLIEKELERIRKGIHKKPNHGHESHPNSSRTQNYDGKPGSHVLTVVSPRQQRFSFPQTFGEFETDIDTRPSAEENQLFQAIILLQANPSALVPILNAHAQSKAYLDTLERISPRLSADGQKHFLPRYISKADSATASERTMLRNKYETLLQRKNSFLKNSSSKKKRKNALLRSKQNVHINDKPASNATTIIVEPPATEEDTVLPLPSDVEQSYAPVSDAKQIHAFVDDDIAPLDDDKRDKTLPGDDMMELNVLTFDPEQDHIVDNRRLLATGSALNSDTPIRERQFAETEHSTPVPRSSHLRPFDHAHFAGDHMMQNSREGLRRQSSSDKQPSERKASQSTVEGQDGYSATKAMPALDKRISASKLMFPPTDADMYNPDGSKRTVHNLPDFDTSYGEAQKARYIRNSEQLDRDRELTPNEIFGK